MIAAAGLEADEACGSSSRIRVAEEPVETARIRPGRIDQRVEAHPRERRPAAYGSTVEAWHAARAERLEAALAAHLGAGEVGAILAWGDPALYDSILRILDRILARGRVAFRHSVVPGLSSMQVLAARHGVPLNGIGGSVLITTGRRLAAGWPPDSDSVVVMLDGDPAFAHLDPDLTIFWGAYLGGPDEILVSGRLGSVGDEIRRVRAEARARHGWIMDIYLLRRGLA